MWVLVLASRKGGAGKTTSACHLAVEAVRAGAGPVALLDTDPMQGAAQWWDARKEDTPTLIKGAVAEVVPLLRQRGGAGYWWWIPRLPLVQRLQRRLQKQVWC